MSVEYILFDFVDETTLLDKDNMLRLLFAVVESGTFQFLKKAIVCDDSPGLNYVPSEPTALANAWNNAIRARQRYNGYWMEFENADGAPQGVRFSFGFSPDEARRLYLTAKKTDLRSDNAMREFIRIAELIFNTLRPEYGFGLFSYDTHETPEIGAFPFALWDYNFFSAGLTHELGREALSAIPAARLADLAGGGLLLEMSPNPITLPQIKNYREASAALGFARYYQGG
ncbi:MAG: hypothetical protein ABI835_13030 [Chloroflexota bacterium]